MATLLPLAATLSTGLFGSALTLDVLLSVALDFDSRAGAGALAALAPKPPELGGRCTEDDRTSGLLAAIFASGATGQAEEIPSFALPRISTCVSLISDGTEATTLAGSADC
jgi:hypothetical protein